MKLTKRQKHWIECCKHPDGIEAVTGGQLRTANSLVKKGLIEIIVNGNNQNRCYVRK